MSRLSLIIAFVSFCPQVWARTLYVPTDKYATIQSAIDDANDGEAVIVSAGLYHENIDFRGKAVTLRSVDPNDPNVVAATVIDGSQPADPNIGSAATFTSGEDADSVLSGFTVQNGTGQADPCGASWYWKGTNGGGVFCRGSSPTVTNNVFKDCAVQYGGGAIYCHDRASPTIVANTFIGNSAGAYGGAIFARLRCSPFISKNVFKRNQCGVLGGAIYLADQCYSRVTNNWIEGNISTHLSAGGLYYFVSSSPVIACNFFVANSSKVTGSAIKTSGDSTGLIINNLFAQNRLTQATSYGAALGIYTNPVVANNIIVDNMGNGIYVGSGANPTLHNNDVWNNALDNYAGYVGDQTGINGNISADPLIGPELPAPFTSFELQPDSPCINAGNNSHLPAWLTSDYDGTSRTVKGVVDMGPQEDHFIAVPRDFGTIQQAISAASSGDEIIVSPGLYQENISFLGKNITLRSLNPLDPNCVRHTVIDGNNLASCITLNSGEDKRAVIAGLSIQNGHGEFGGGIYIADNGGATILYNYIHNNKADRYGGGVDTRHYSDTVIQYNRIEDNYTGFAGGGIHVGHHARCKIRRNRIAENQTPFAGQGGGIYCYNWADVDITENEICHNWTSSGGALYTWKAGGTVARNHIWGNFGNAIGGAIALDHASGAPSSHMDIVNNLISGNRTNGRGGAVWLRLGTTAIINNTIAGNVSNPNSGAGVAIESAAYADITNNIIADNLGGAGIHLALPSWDPNLLVEPDVVSNDLWSNQAGNYAGELADQTGVNHNISADPCFVEPGCWDSNNTPNDPNDDYWVRGDYHVIHFSPCRDAGADYKAPDEDFEADPRPSFRAVDIGADEISINNFSGLGILAESWLAEGPAMLADLDHNLVVDFRDFALLANDWLLQ